MSLTINSSWWTVISHPLSADGAKYGIQTLSPKLFGSKPDFVVSGPNNGCEHAIFCWILYTYVIISSQWTLLLQSSSPELCKYLSSHPYLLELTCHLVVPRAKEQRKVSPQLPSRARTRARSPTPLSIRTPPPPEPSPLVSTPTSRPTSCLSSPPLPLTPNSPRVSYWTSTTPPAKPDAKPPVTSSGYWLECSLPFSLSMLLPVIMAEGCLWMILWWRRLDVSRVSLRLIWTPSWMHRVLTSKRYSIAWADSASLAFLNSNDW